VITIIVVIVLASPTWAEIVGAYADACGFLAVVLAVSRAAAKERGHRIQRGSGPHPR